ncbi:V-type proton ATPase subunit C 1-like [Antechinus flavipes]|uniref:V-type proton ATPase subunit C 1-like n=1 Tax=Antechinus flavipes TaxID=38775 RepID=UPI002235F90D|nr:V-type proton ATPase subunit C 1-like [Antechinus flavipes]
MSEFWLISVPGDKTCQQAWEKLQAATTKSNLSTNSKFSIPELKIGTLDILISLSDELDKLDSLAEINVKEMSKYMTEVLEDSEDKAGEMLLVDGLDLVTYLTRFQWNMAKYPITESLKSLAEMMAKGAKQISNDFRARSSSYNELKVNIQNLEKKNAGSLLTRSLVEIVKKEDFVLDSEYLITLLVVVPKSHHNDWVKQYETLVDMVVPRSSQVISEDQDNYLCNVTLFRKAVTDFIKKAREKKFVVRDFQYDEEQIKADKEEVANISTDRKNKLGLLIRWLKVNFSEAFVIWIHVKALRVFVESILRYGLPVNFQAMLLQPNKKNIKKLREVLYDLYKHLDDSSGAIINFATDVQAYKLNDQEYYPYVFFKVDCNPIQLK